MAGQRPCLQEQEPAGPACGGALGSSPMTTKSLQDILVEQSQVLNPATAGWVRQVAPGGPAGAQAGIRHAASATPSGASPASASAAARASTCPPIKRSLLPGQMWGNLRCHSSPASNTFQRWRPHPELHSRLRRKRLGDHGTPRWWVGSGEGCTARASGRWCGGCVCQALWENCGSWLDELSRGCDDGCVRIGCLLCCWRTATHMSTHKAAWLESGILVVALECKQRQLKHVGYHGSFNIER
ncbi:hypothetical protein Vretifemale_17570 [Volvox reticuliferus]|uniref:Uncharacterized protein n=1 Tax=Volvox reticuliferus TaxID=1737510 RepID=A0A8J4CVV3_9CHLO|nr:hypothetical protein Vretifemale_17570 [Volvox reticuliferus]